jgi:hypothetical protein
MAEKTTSWDIAVGVFGGMLMFTMVEAVGSNIYWNMIAQNVIMDFKNAISHSPVPTAAPAATQQVPQQRLVTVPAGSVKDCLDASNGVADMQYAKCRQTHQELQY